jgi:Concanavalin A-like lectin/glucanases superfamily
MTNETNTTGLVAHWPLTDDFEDHIGGGLTVSNHGVKLGALGPTGRPGAARFNGTDAYLEVPHHPALNLGTGDFTVSAWLHTEAEQTDVIGNIISKFDPDNRRGFQLYILTSSGVTSTAQPNYRHLHFGIDNAHLDQEWADWGRPGNAVLIVSLLTRGGQLYASTLEIGASEMGHLWRYDHGGWIDLGNPVGCSVVSTATEFKGSLYAGLGRYIGHGSDLGNLPNRTPGGQVYRVEPDGQWVYCGHPGAEDATPEETPEGDFSGQVHARSSGEVVVSPFSSGKADDVIALTVYQGHLYCTSIHRRGAFVYDGDRGWKYIGPDERIMSFTVYHGRLYALINGGPVYRYEGGAEWTHCGHPEKSIQTYSAVTYRGQLYIGSWPEAEVHRYDGGTTWTPVTLEGRVGYERELMGAALYNGKVYIGSLPMANVWRMDTQKKGAKFVFVGNLDASPASLKRVWSMAIYQGRLLGGTLPSGHVRAIEAGKMATWDQAFPAGWRHVAAVKRGSLLQLYVDGKRVAASNGFNPGYFNLNNEQPLLIGFGMHDYFNGLMSDLRLYNRALAVPEITDLARIS